jgi:KaiC/GvpD/RAD55 family RecA-like ATPase
MEDERVPTFIKGLDAQLEGGIPKQYIVLLCGHAGTMKSSVGYSILYNGNRNNGTKGIYLTLEQSKESIAEHMTRLGMPSDGMEDLVIIDLAKVRKDMVKDRQKGENIDWPNAIISALRNYKEAYECEVLVFDSLAALYALTSFNNPRAELFHFFEELRDLKITNLLISEMPTDKMVYGLYGIEDFLSDGIIHLKVEQESGTTNLYLGVVKMRKTNHPRAFFPLIFDGGKFEIVTQ